MESFQQSQTIITNRKGWHTTISQDLRNHLVLKVVQAIFPCPDEYALTDIRMRNLTAYARKVENNVYQSANSKNQYYHLLAEKIYRLKKEIEEKKTSKDE